MFIYKKKSKQLYSAFFLRNVQCLYRQGIAEKNVIETSWYKNKGKISIVFKNSEYLIQVIHLGNDTWDDNQSKHPCLWIY
jgi:hypothetical protein